MAESSKSSNADRKVAAAQLLNAAPPTTPGRQSQRHRDFSTPAGQSGLLSRFTSMAQRRYSGAMPDVGHTDHPLTRFDQDRPLTRFDQDHPLTHFDQDVVLPDHPHLVQTSYTDSAFIVSGSSLEAPVTRGNGKTDECTLLCERCRKYLLRTVPSDPIHPLECTIGVPHVLKWFSCMSRSPASLVNVEDIVTASQPKVILIEGAPRVGKSTLCTQLSFKWANKEILEEFKLILLIQLDMAKKNITSLEELWQFVEITQGLDSDLCREIISKLGSGVLIIIDGLDEYDSAGRRWKGSVIQQLLTRQLFHNATLLVTVRPSLMDKLEDVGCHFDSSVTISGFSEGSVKEYFSSRLSSEGLGYEDRVWEWFGEKKAVKDFCRVPQVCSIVLEVYRESNFILPETETELMDKIVLKLVKKELTKRGSRHAETIHSLSELPEPLKTEFKLTCQLSLLVMSIMPLGLDMEGLARAVSSFCLKQTTEEVNPTYLGYVEGVLVRHSHRHSFRYPQLLHPSLLHFLMAVGLREMPFVDQIHFFHTHLTKNGMDHATVVTFHFGLSALPQYNPDLAPSGIVVSEVSSTVNPSKIALTSILETVIYSLGLNESSNLRHRMFLFNCIQEARQPTLWKRLGTKYQDLIKLELARSDLGAMLALLSTMMIDSGISKWALQVPMQDKDTAGALAFSCEPAVDISITYGSRIILVPTVSATARSRAQRARENDRTYNPIHSFCCKCIKDIFQAVFQLFNPVSIQSYHTDPGYISLVSCQCLQDSVTTSVVFMPVHAGHVIPMPRKAKKRELTPAEEQHWDTHESTSSELILMTTPYPTGISFTTLSGEKIDIRISSDHEGLSLGIPQIDLEAHVTEVEAESLVRCAAETHRGGPTKILVPEMPLPRRDYVEPRLSYTKAESPNHTHLPTPFPVRSEHSGTQQARQSQAGRGGQEGAWSPGTVLHTTKPNLFRTDQIHPLPEESPDTLIRAGGNGRIFRATFKGGQYAVKKTTFRTRECQILMRVEHRNIVPLIALILGEPHPLHRRRTLCYHVMPLMSGDCARLITDQPQFHLKEIRHLHGDNPQLTGLMIGNMKYLLAEVLRGLQYLHSLNIVHRDVKASNILVKTSCRCEHILTCRCSRKFDVCLADFDAACELSPAGHLLPYRPSERAKEMFIVAAVGTSGFRPPECCLYSVSNDPSTFQPTISVKADIWSFGILLLRMFVGVDGHTSQREVAMLLMAYHQQKGELRHKGMDDTFITPQRLNRLLRLPQLQGALHGLPNAIDLVTICLKVKPDERPSTTTLLQHPFLT